MSSITITRACGIEGTSYAVADVVTDLDFDVAGAAVLRGDAYWTVAGGPARPLPNSTAIATLPDVSALTGGTSAALDGYSTLHIPTGRAFRIIVDGVARIYQLQAAGENVADDDLYIEPPDFDETSNNRLFALLSGPVPLVSELQMATAKLLGRTTASTGDVEEISVSSPLTLADGALAVPAAADQAYTPTTSGDWSPAPTTIAGALDQLAARVKALEDA